jgi:hypothetical protein
MGRGMNGKGMKHRLSTYIPLPLIPLPSFLGWITAARAVFLLGSPRHLAAELPRSFILETAVGSNREQRELCENERSERTLTGANRLTCRMGNGHRQSLCLFSRVSCISRFQQPNLVHLSFRTLSQRFFVTTAVQPFSTL